MRRVTVLSLPVALALTGLLSGCSGDGPHPATAVSIDDTTVSTSHVDNVANRYCEALTEVGNGNVVTAQAVRSEVVTALTLRLAVEKYADEQGLGPDASYAKTIAQLRSQIGDFDEDTQDAIVEVNGAETYLSSVVGDDQDAFTSWLADQDVELNPVYGIKLHGDSVTQVDGSISVAESDTAKSALSSATDPTSADASGLPSSQRCG